jgi:hypothetical protein
MATDTIGKVIEDFCTEFVNFPYLCYTEHGLHARFYCLLYNALPTNQRYIEWKGMKICVIQKEYRTATNLGKSKRQNWDIAILQPLQEQHGNKNYAYDYLSLNSVIEFGLNAGEKHLIDDIKRLCHSESNVKNKFIVHLYRISGPGRKRISHRDISTNSKKLLQPENVQKLIQNNDVIVYFGLFDSTKQYQPGAWRLDKNEITELQVTR